MPTTSMNDPTKNQVSALQPLTPDALKDVILKMTGSEHLRGPLHHLFHINRIEDIRPDLHFPRSPYRKTVTDFMFITQGSMVRRLALTSYTVPTNTFVFLPAYQISLDEWMSEDIRGYYCHFDATLLTKRWQKQDLENEFPFLKFLGYPLVTIDSETLANVMPLIRRLQAEYKKTQPDSVDLLRLYLLTLFTELKRAILPADQTLAEGRPNSTALRFTQLYKNALTQYIYDKQNVSDYADLLHISPNHLNKCVKAATGQSARDLLDEMILLEAKVLLDQTDLSISEIAYRIGHQEPGNFARFFKLKTGKTPKEYRVVD